MSDRVASSSNYMPIVADADDEAVFLRNDHQQTALHVKDRWSSGYCHQPDVYEVPTVQCTTANTSFATPPQSPSPESIPRSDIDANRFFFNLPPSNKPQPKHLRNRENCSSVSASPSWRQWRVFCQLLLLTIMITTSVNCSPLRRSSKLICVHGSPRDQHSDGLSPCLCDSGWTGQVCDIQEDLSCVNGDTSSGGTTCICYANYYGRWCEHVHCFNGIASGGTCTCDEGWRGKFCDQIVCRNGAIPHPKTADRCLCQSDFVGKHCEFCAFPRLPHCMESSNDAVQQASSSIPTADVPATPSPQHPTSNSNRISKLRQPLSGATISPTKLAQMPTTPITPSKEQPVYTETTASIDVMTVIFVIVTGLTAVVLLVASTAVILQYRRTSPQYCKAPIVLEESYSHGDPSSDGEGEGPSNSRSTSYHSAASSR